MIYNIAFIIVGIAWLVGIMYLQMCLNGIVVHIDRRHPLKNKRNSWKLGRQIGRIQKETKDEELKKLANKYSYYTRTSLLVLVGGFVLMIIIGTLNAWQNASVTKIKENIIDPEEVEHE